MTESQRDELIDLIGTAWEEAENVCISTGDDDPVASDVSSILAGAYSDAEDCKETLANIESMLNDIECTDEDEDTEPEEKAPCTNCGQR